MRGTLSILQKRIFGTTFSSISLSTTKTQLENPITYPEKVHRNESEGHVFTKFSPHVRPTLSLSSSNYEIICQTFYSVLLPMKCFGMFPFSRSSNGSKKVYCRPTFIVNVYTAMAAIVVSTCVTLYTLNRGFDIPWPFRLWVALNPHDILSTNSGGRLPPNFFIWVTLGLQIIIPVSTMVYGFVGFLYIPGYCTFLNRWLDYIKLLETHFCQCSFSTNFTDLKRCRNYYACTYFLLLLVTFFLIPFLANTKVLQVADGRFSSLSTVITFVWVESLIAIRVIAAMKDFLSLQVLEIAYRELRKGIQTQYTVLQEKVSRTHVRNWLKLVIFIRNQRTLLEMHMAPQTNWMLFEIFVVALLVLTASVVVIVHEIEEYMGWVTTYVGISMAFIFFLFFKAQLAERISEQEELLAEAIVGMTGCNDCDTRLEMKSLCDLIFHDPIKITLGYVFVLNKRLMLTFCSQLAASLVILLQFVNH